MRRAGALVAALLLLALLTAFPARGETVSDALLERVGFERVEALAERLDLFDAGTFLKKALAGELRVEAGWPERALQRLKARVWKALTRALSALAAPLLLSLLLRLALGRNDDAMALLCRLACAGSLMRRFAGALAETRDFVSAAATMAGTVAPVLSAALALAGSASSAAMLTPLSALCADVIESVLLKYCLPACALAAAVAVAGGLSPSFKLDRLLKFTVRATTWLVGLLLAGFAALLAAQGRLAAAQDAGTTRAAGQALLSLIPVVGGAMSDSTGALLDSAVAVKNAVGVTGAALALAACAKPVLKLAVYALAVRLASAVIEPMADPGVTGIVAGFGEALRLLLAVCAGSGMLVALLAGTCLA